MISIENETLVYSEIYTRFALRVAFSLTCSCVLLLRKYPSIENLVEQSDENNEDMLEHILTYVDAERWALEQIRNTFFNVTPQPLEATDDQRIYNFAEVRIPFL